MVPRIRSWWGEESLRPDVGRGVRSTVGLMVPLGLATAGWLPFETSFVVIAAHSMTLADVRGAYPVRFGFLVAMGLVLAGTTLLGTWVAGGVWMAVLATVVVGLNSGLWRHLTPEYGPALAVPAGLLFFMALTREPGEHALAVLVGAGWGLVVQVGMWPVRQEHPLRRAVAESWVAVGALCAAIARGEGVAQKEAALRGALDNGYEILEQGKGKRARGIVGRLEELHLSGARLATRVGALNTAIEPVAGKGGVGEAWKGVAESLGNTARAVGMAVVSRQPAHLAVAEVRVKRAGSLLESLRVRVGEGDRVVAGISKEVEARLGDVGRELRGTVDRAGERAIFPLELLDLNTWRLKPLAGVLNLSTKPDPAIVRFTVRSVVVMMLAVWGATRWPYPHGYWLPYTVLVVLQADYGATRVKAGQRLLGTLVGVVLGSGLLMLRLPLGWILTGVAGAGLMFGFYMRRNYAVAVVFITLFVVLLTEAHQRVTVELTIERLASTVAGGVLAMVAAVLFWPAWERGRFPGLLAGAIRGNAEYLGMLLKWMESGVGDRDLIMAEKKRVERGNRAVFGSLERLYADPARTREGTEKVAAVLANGNQRLTRALNVIAVRMEGERGELGGYGGQLVEALNEVAEEVGKWGGGEVGKGREVRVPVVEKGEWCGEALMRAGTEVMAMRAAVGEWRRKDEG